jgi:hypothetical protein
MRPKKRKGRRVSPPALFISIRSAYLAAGAASVFAALAFFGAFAIVPF